MKYFYLSFLLVIFSLPIIGQTTISGIVTDGDSNEPLIGATISLKGTGEGTITNDMGKYSLVTSVKPPFSLSCNYVGYAPKEILITAETSEVNFAMGQTNIITDEIVVSASRKAEKITQSPSTINIIKARQFEEAPSFNPGELIARQKGVDYFRAGVLGTGFNVRGFNSAFNPKNLQVNDNRISSLVATGLPLGALGTTIKEDIERVELILGPTATLYGPNANNGLISTITKDPRVSQGTTLALGVGNQSVFSGRLRHAEKLSNKFAYKITGEFTQGTEFDYVDTVYIGTDPRTALAKTELDLDRDFKSVKGEASLYFTPSAGKDIIFTYGGSNSSNIGLTNAGRNQIKDWRINFYQLKYTSPRIFAQFYCTQSRTDSTYAMNQRTQNYWAFKNAGFSDAEASKRSFAESWFGTKETGIALKRGALFQDKSNRINGELQYNNTFQGVSYVIGAQYQLDQANSNGTYLLDNNGEGVDIAQVGGYLQLERTFGTKFKAVLGARADNHDLYGFNFIPKGALVYLLENGSVRLTYGKGIAAPTILNLEGNLFGGLVLGNGSGFTIRDVDKTSGVITESTINPLKVETLQTFELGYKSAIGTKFFVDGNAYYNTSENFLSPLFNIGANTNTNITRTVYKRGDALISEVIPGTAANGAATVLTYLNFGRVNTYGLDLGLNYYFSNQFSAGLNYSYFNFDLDETDPNNDGDKNGIVNKIDLPLNTPTHKMSLALNYSGKKLFGSILTRWVQCYDFISGINVAAASNPDIFQNLAANAALGLPAEKYTLQEGKRYGRYFNNGPLGGFVNVDLSLGYRITDKITVAGQVTNVFDSESVREFIASPYIGRLYQAEVKINLPGYKKM
jgi:outer membrane receptor for ferrienterochelin and colicins